ncbi:MAG: hypothetical protein EAZ51_06040 [Sphingobacteriales bacterium]|nr:MAG: hypothetical protein EAZ64_06935 [Sphingobacteriales bacterium]TAF80451.1 MAG: hypothetical protein EAZ51_06040 [Sphingobacteriales bacterium]
MKNIFLVVLVCVLTNAAAQHKVDVLVLGASPSGVSCAIQAARSAEGARQPLKIMLIEATENLLPKVNPTFNQPAFDSGLYKEWKDNYQINHQILQHIMQKKIPIMPSLLYLINPIIHITPQNTLLNMVKKLKNLSLHTYTKVIGISTKKNGWVVKIEQNGATQEIKTNILVDASDSVNNSQLVKYNIMKLNSEGKINNLVTYTKGQHGNNNLYRTSIGAGTNGKEVFYFPVGMFVPTQHGKLIIVSAQTCSNGFSKNAFNNLATQLSMGQGAGVLAAYAPFFTVAPKDANVRVLQSEVLNYKGQFLPIKDVVEQDSAYKPIQQTITSGLLKMNFEEGLFYPDSVVNMAEIKPIMSQLYTRSKLWFIENSTATLNLENLMALISFISAREVSDILTEINSKWNKKYGFATNFDVNKPLTRKQFAIVVNDYLQPYKVRVNFNGEYLR